MSRHRHFQAINQNYHEYDDGYEDDEEYGGSSYSDQYCVSPGTAAQFTFNRDHRGNQFADFLSKEDENEITEEPYDEDDYYSPRSDLSASFEKPQLTDEEQAKLLSCMDVIRDVIGDTLPDGIVTKAIIESRYDSERALDRLLQMSSTEPTSEPAGVGKTSGSRSSQDLDTVSSNLITSANSLPHLSFTNTSASLTSASHTQSSAPRLSKSTGLSLRTSGASPVVALGTSNLSLANLNKVQLGHALSSGSSLSSLAQTHLQSKPQLNLGKPSDGKLQLNLGKPSDGKLQLNLGKPSDGKLQLNLRKPSDGKLQLSLGKPSDGKLQLNFGQPADTESMKHLHSGNAVGLMTRHLSLSAALRPKPASPSARAEREEEVMEWADSNEPALPTAAKEPPQLLPFEEEVNELLAKEASMLGQILCSRLTSRHSSSSLADDCWSYSNQLSLIHPLLQTVTRQQQPYDIVPFDFSSPSPDDVVLAKQRGAFTRTGERVVPPSERPSNKTPTKPSKLSSKPAQFHIGDPARSDEDTEAKLSESTSQLSLKSYNGANSKKEPKTPISAQLKGVKALIEAEGTKSPSLSRSSSKSKLERLDALAEYEKRSEDGKELINLVVIGHVDAGKSTLMGHVLYQLGIVSQRQMHRYEMDSKKLGKASFMYAWVLDETEEERSRGVTMDVAQTRFETKTRTINLLDAPGHKDFIPNMITGAAQADCALLVVNSTRGEFETGFESGGQTREHTILIRSLGVSQLVVAINKMDTVGWSQTRFLEIASKLSVFLKQAGFKESDIQYIPCSGLEGTNLVKPVTGVPELSWYTGKPLIDEIENFKPPVRLVNKPLRMCVQDMFKGQSGSFSVAGRMEAGDIQNGDRVMVMPSAEYATVKGILIDERSERIGFAGDYVTLQLVGIDIQKVHVGCVLCDPTSPVPVVSRFRARLVIFNIDVPITKGSPVVYHSQSLNEPAHISRLISKLHKNTGEVLKSKPRCLTKNSTAVVEITLTRPQCLELYKDFKDLGRFMLRSEGHTIAAGVVVEMCSNRT